MQILTISGSTRPESSNIKLLKALPNFLPNADFQYFPHLGELPLFVAEKKADEKVKNWQSAVQKADAVIICTPEYIHNIPALLKNALEWLVDSGELYNKRVLAMTFTPNAPRGEKAMQSLIWSLQALNANIVGQLPLYANEIAFEKGEIIAAEETKELLVESLKTLG
ncbi:MAG: NADPH-dependent FMN reductase [Bacteroidota bacterium]